MGKRPVQHWFLEKRPMALGAFWSVSFGEHAGGNSAFACFAFWNARHAFAGGGLVQKLAIVAIACRMLTWIWGLSTKDGSARGSRLQVGKKERHAWVFGPWDLSLTTNVWGHKQTHGWWRVIVSENSSQGQSKKISSRAWVCILQ